MMPVRNADSTCLPSAQAGEVQAISLRWSVRELRQNIKSDLYQQAKARGELVTTMPLSAGVAVSNFPELPEPSEAFKDVYHWDFLKLSPSYTERQLEDALIASVERLLMELGPDFYLGGRQQKMIIDACLCACLCVPHADRPSATTSIKSEFCFVRYYPLFCSALSSHPPHNRFSSEG